MSELNISRKRHIGNGELDNPAQDAEPTDSWEPARKRLRSLVRQFRALSLADLGWKRSRTPPLPLPEEGALEVPELRLPPSPCLQRRLHPSPEPHHRVLPAAELTITLAPSDELRSRLLQTPAAVQQRLLQPSPELPVRAAARRRGDSDGSRSRVRPIETHFVDSAAVSGRTEPPGGGAGGAAGRAASAELGRQLSADQLAGRPLKRHELSECGSAAKKSRSRMRAGANTVVMTSCYIEQIVYP